MSETPVIGDLVNFVTSPFRAIGDVFTGAPSAPRLPKPPSPNDPAVQAAMEEERRAQAALRGRASTILTGAQGATGETVSRRTLLGT